MVKLVAIGIAAVIVIIYLIIKSVKGEFEFDSNLLKVLLITLLVVCVNVAIIFIWVLNQ